MSRDDREAIRRQLDFMAAAKNPPARLTKRQFWKALDVKDQAFMRELSEKFNIEFVEAWEE